MAGISKERDFKIPVPVRIGSSGVGQSCSVAEKCVSGGWSVYFKPLGKWWVGYRGQQAVVTDDTNGWIAYTEMLGLMDRCPHKMPIKGASVEFNSRYSSSSPPCSWYSSERCVTTLPASYVFAYWKRWWHPHKLHTGIQLVTNKILFWNEISILRWLLV